MGTIIKAFKFEPFLKSVLWGGEKIAPYKGLNTNQQKIGESWEISSVEGHESIVAEGPDKGLTLVEIIDKYKGDLVGEKIYEKYGNVFPLLVKIIDAKQDLSIQVHPDDKLARERGSQFGKTEMWYIIDAEKEAKIGDGFSKKISASDYEKLIADGAIMDVISQYDAHNGDAFFIPAGRIHSIGGGTLLAEIQQTSDTTYRVFDFNRTDSMGKKRELHTEQAKDAIDYNVYDDCVIPCSEKIEGEKELVKCSYFDVKRIIVKDKYEIKSERKDSFRILMCLGGTATVTDNNGNVTEMRRGETVLVPAIVNKLILTGDAEMLSATV